MGWLQDRHKWPGLKGIVVVESKRESGDKVETETRLFITSSAMDAQQLAPFVRGHWAVENSLHWVLDMVFRDDECRIRTENAPVNFATIKHIATNLLRKAPGKGSMLMKSHKAAWDDTCAGVLACVIPACVILAAAPVDAGTPASPPADLRPMQRYGADHPDCLGWTDGCVICTQKACSTPGIACTPGATVCTVQAEPPDAQEPEPPDAQKPEPANAPKPDAPKPAEPPPVAPPAQKP